MCNIKNTPLSNNRSNNRNLLWNNGPKQGETTRSRQGHKKEEEKKTRYVSSTRVKKKCNSGGILRTVGIT